MQSEDDAWRHLKSLLQSLHRAGLADVPLGQWQGQVKSDSQNSGTTPDDQIELTAKTDSIPIQSTEALVVPTEGNRIPQPSEQRSFEETGTPSSSGSLFQEILNRKPVDNPKRSEELHQFKTTRPPISSMFDNSRIPYETLVNNPEQRLQILNDLAREVAECTRCPHLAATRTQTVFSSGDCIARLMFIGEAPGADEDQQGIPFVGRAGQLLTDIITKGMGLSREDVYVANVLKCRPPGNRNPNQDEIANCFHFLDRQIETVRPEFICLLGRIAVGAVLQTALPMKQLRLRWHRYRDIPVMVTYHPAYLLRNPPAKKETWEDLKMLMKEMGIEPPKSKN